MQPLVSIVIPVYNGSDYLREAIESALAQTYLSTEVIVVNDGSTDGGATEAIARSFGERIRYFSKPNGHVSSALNHGIANMRGKYFSWLSHDDMYYPEKVASQVAALESLGADTVVYGDYETLDVESGKRTEHRLPAITPERFRWSLTVAARIHGCTLLVPRACFDLCGMFDTTLRTTQDYDMWFRIAGQHRFVHVPGVVVAARIHPGQGTKQLSDIVVQECNVLLSGFIQHLRRDELAVPHDATPAQAYHELAENMEMRGLSRARDTALNLERASLGSGSAVDATTAPLGVAKLKLSLFLRRGLRFAGRATRYALRKIGNQALGDAVKNRFTAIYQTNAFGSEESRSGKGSSLAQTERIRQLLPGLLREFKVSAMLDAPCGDFNWMRHADLPISEYVGVDVVEELVAKDNEFFGTKSRRFVRMDIIEDSLPQTDLIFCRDCLVHLSHGQAIRILRNFKRSGARYLLTTTFPGTQTNRDLGREIWRPLNLQRAPFNLPTPRALINEGCTEDEGAYADKSLGLWALQELDLEGAVAGKDLIAEARP